eukprot:TRINITY_DN15269_c0_g1_i1.p1 TRINITY_DN15269_c0_g1~~TRINITY_DN15269_c0_g1_i1.p1  ORF type:complete len:198 (+),score=41.54 TRINITY_DN15269_c0_g1_i1:57-650(+)
MAADLSGLLQERLKLKENVSELKKENEDLKDEVKELRELIEEMRKHPLVMEVVEIWENQRRLPLPFTSYTEKDLVPGERTGWTNATGFTRSKKFVDEDGWEWTDELHIDKEGADAEGWHYAFNWDFQYTNQHSNINTFVRRRRWIRTRRSLTPFKGSLSIDLPKDTPKKEKLKKKASVSSPPPVSYKDTKVTTKPPK